MGKLAMNRSRVLSLLPGGWPRQKHTLFYPGSSTRPVVSQKDTWGHRSLASISSPQHDMNNPPPSPYNRPVEAIRKDEYPHMNNGTYLDHSGTTIYARSTISRFATKMTSSLLGNPHSANEPAKISGDMVDDVRLRTLRFLGADPRHFDLVFVANATAGIKLVADAFRDLGEQTRSGTFWYGYHRDCHTSLVGVRELTGGDHVCFAGNGEVEGWLDGSNEEKYRDRSSSTLRLFSYPAQSNLTGRRLPLSWTGRIRRKQNTYTLLDAAAMAMTSPLDGVFGRPDDAPDFTCVSFYKIFGFPDLGGLVVRRESGHVLALRKYFGGGTVGLVGTLGGAWHTSRGLDGAGGENGDGDGKGHVGGLHEGLEDGTLPFHSILALGEAIDVHGELYGSMENVSRHTTGLVKRLYRGIRGLRYGNGQVLCKVYFEDGKEGEEGGGDGVYGDAERQGATVAFNVFEEDGGYISYASVERMANERGVFIRSGGVCCPGGVFAALQYEPWQLNRARSAGHHCGPDGLGIIHELPTGVVRASLGAMSTARDVDTFISFLRESFLNKQATVTSGTDSMAQSGDPKPSSQDDV